MVAVGRGDSSESEPKGTSALAWVGLVLWRAGELLVAGASIYYVCREVLRYFTVPEFPLTLEVGITLVVTGFLLVVLTLILERVVDARSEGDLKS